MSDEFDESLEPIELPITDVLDLHSFPPTEVPDLGSSFSRRHSGAETPQQAPQYSKRLIPRPSAVGTEAVPIQLDGQAELIDTDVVDVDGLSPVAYIGFDEPLHPTRHLERSPDPSGDDREVVGRIAPPRVLPVDDCRWLSWIKDDVLSE